MGLIGDENINRFERTFKGDGFTAYEFSLKEDILIEESDLECSYFRLDIHDDGDMKVYVTSEDADDYFVNEDVTHLFSLKKVLLAIPKQSSITDVQEDYDQWYAHQSWHFNKLWGYKRCLTY